MIRSMPCGRTKRSSYSSDVAAGSSIVTSADSGVWTIALETRSVTTCASRSRSQQTKEFGVDIDGDSSIRIRLREIVDDVANELELD